MSGFVSAKAFVEELDNGLARVRERLILNCCESLEDVRGVCDLCGFLGDMTIREFEKKEAEGFSDEAEEFKTFILLNMVLVGGMMIQKWLGEKGTEYEEMKGEA